MKTVYKYSIALILLATAMSCSKSFLDKQPIGQIGRDGLFQDVQGARVALNGAYNRVAYYYAREFTLYGDVASDDVVVLQSSTGGSGQQLTMFDEYNFQSTRDGETSAVGHIWLNILEATNNINNIINAIPDLKSKYPKSTGELDSIMGQALILRALCHFDLSKVYAQQYKFTADASHLGVPVLLKTPSPKELIARKTMKETYAQIIADLKTGVDLLNQHPFSNRFAATSQAGMALLSRVYLYMGEWDNALDYANKVIQQGGFTLASGNDYATMFLKDSVQGEMIFKLFCRKAQSSSLTSTIATYYANTQAKAADALFNSFDTNDVRKTNTMTATRSTLKYGKDSTRNAAGGLDWIADPKVIRLSELYLIRAEALWQKGQYTAAADDIKKISQRAHLTTTVNITYSSPAELYKIIADERRRELCFEGFRLYDLGRRKESIIRGADCIASKCTVNYPNARYVLPIPGKELDANRAMQPNPEIN